MMRAEVVGSVTTPIPAPDRTVCQYRGMAFTTSQLDELLSENDRLRVRLATVTAELDNVLPSKVDLVDALRRVLDESINYKAQADDFEAKWLAAVDERDESRTRVDELEDQLADVKDTHGWDLNA